MKKEGGWCGGVIAEKEESFRKGKVSQKRQEGSKTSCSMVNTKFQLYKH